MGLFNEIVSGASKAWDYVNENEWAADAIAGAAGAGLTYLQQKDQQKHEERLYRMRNDWENERYYAQGAGNSKSTQYGSLTKGLLTQGAS
ncbi:hypothetical protein [Hahella ganghwensis]|uniref:hypothetical protein n=1 Tax=Hahella ganghwensis TaxID=286420 RepID=UPI00037BB1CF|nr:hypothetical protein [Hahella ganghwensis]